MLFRFRSAKDWTRLDDFVGWGSAPIPDHAVYAAISRKSGIRIEEIMRHPEDDALAPMHASSWVVVRRQFVPGISDRVPRRRR